MGKVPFTWDLGVFDCSNRFLVTSKAPKVGFFTFWTDQSFLGALLHSLFYWISMQFALVLGFRSLPVQKQVQQQRISQKPPRSKIHAHTHTKRDKSLYEM